MKTFVSVVLIILSALLCLAQEPEKQGATQQIQIAEILDRKGWKVPGVTGARIIQHARWTTEGLEGIFADTLKPVSPNTSVLLLTTVRDKPGAIEVRQQQIEVTEILRFSMNGRTFAYRITAIPQSIDSRGKRTSLGSEERLAFYDVDGTGKFTVMQDAGDFGPFVPMIPGWVKKPPLPPNEKDKREKHK